MLRYFRWMVLGALLSLIALIFMGAIVRATGAGLGCPDWPRCWGCLIPPWKVEQVDLDKINFERFQAKAERLGRDPSTVTRETILESFNPVHTWTEFINRLLSLPVGFFSLGTLVCALSIRGPDRGRLLLVGVLGVVIVGVNAWMGAKVVYSGLKPGIITLHMALAMVLLCLWVYGFWVGKSRPAGWSGSGRKKLKWAVGGLLLLTIAEVILGSQIREMTDILAKKAGDAPRSEWTEELERSGLYLVHRSFSWVILIVACMAFFFSRENGRVSLLPKAVLGIVLALMAMGVVLSFVGVLPWVQILHVGAAAILVSLLSYWVLCLGRSPKNEPLSANS